MNLKAEYPSYLDPDAPPKCKSVNGDDHLQPCPAPELLMFMRAFKRANRSLFQQLGRHIRDQIESQSVPREILGENGVVFLDEKFEDNALAYVSSQIMLPDERDDGWHTDGGSSLLHAALTLFGERDLLVEDADGKVVTLPQKPGDFYMGNMCALRHNVRHRGGEHQKLFGALPAVEIAIMFRTDVFRKCRARKINAQPSPAELYRIVNEETAKFLAEHPFVLPDLAAVAAECVR